jgi:DnaJ-class molecular chaperone
MANPYERPPSRPEGSAERRDCANCRGRGYVNGEKYSRCGGSGKVSNRS